MSFFIRKHFSKNTAEKWILFLLVAAIIPFILLAAFCHPSVDDFWLTNMVLEDSAWSAFWKIRESWSGRYTSIFLGTLNPLVYHSLVGYRILSLVIFMLTIAGTYYLVSSLFPATTVRQKLLLTLMLITLFLGFMPVVAQVFYWMSGALNYQTGCIAFLFFCGLLLQQASANNKSKFKYFATLLLAFFIVGSNETVMAFMFYLSVLLFGLYVWQKRQVNFQLAGLLLTVCVGCYLVIGAPGNAVRSAEYPDQGQIFYSAMYATAIVANNSLNWFTLTPILLLTILFIPFCCRQPPLFPSHNLLHPVIYWLIFLGGLVTCYFVSYYSKADHAPPRVQDTIYLIFILGWFFNIYYTTAFLTNKGLFIPALPYYAKAFIGIICLLWLFHNKQSNIRTAYSDLLSGRAARYDKEMDERYTYLKKSSCQSCPIKPVQNIPKTIFFEEVDDDTTGWRNLYTAQYFGKRVLLVEKNQASNKADSSAIK